MFPHRSVVAGRLDCWLVAMVFPPCVKEGDSLGWGTVQPIEETGGRGRNRRTGEDHAARVTESLARGLRLAGASRSAIAGDAQVRSKTERGGVGSRRIEISGCLAPEQPMRLVDRGRIQ
jgi:hypothetical protein